MVSVGSELVRLRGVERDFGAGDHLVRALRGIDLCIGRGEFVSIVGPSGSGKSSLTNLIGLLDRPSRGVVRFAGADVSAQDSDALARLRNRHIGFVFQAYHLLPMRSARANVELALAYRGVGRRDRRRLAEAALDRVGLSHRIDATPETMSGGEQQRAAIARALVVDPDLLIADEPTGALDRANGRAVMNLLQTLHGEGRTVVLVTHDPDLAEAADRIVEIRDGLVSHVRAGSQTAPGAAPTGARAHAVH